MMSDKLNIQCYFEDLASKQETYECIAQQVSPSLKIQKMLIEQLEKRATIGNMQIAEHVLLPHIENAVVTESRVLFVRLNEPIEQWDDQTRDIQLLIVILLKANETLEKKQALAAFTRTLADEAYLEHLLTVDQETFQEIVLNSHH